ncbi:putative copper resistance protein D [Actinoalloteichus hoggarensis]|uniref:Copper transport protein YcnJ n=1 Tax=Actinoalloteichus hoggarensis TaxID=1470176 RepID=A0A221VW29_9PSEU|nr:CopD family protein [Actinoalloteichus hoggarensis]ASO17723.1 Copper transport protein YcnJ precursor [Actinoalloteichus hoggarensis]MBB5922849.1 putative copper resistance protein D [Actinoalloteichus hoggarensis]
MSSTSGSTSGRGPLGAPLLTAGAGALLGLTLGLALATAFDRSTTPAADGLTGVTLPALRLAVDVTGTAVVGLSVLRLLLRTGRPPHGGEAATAAKAAAAADRSAARAALAAAAAWALLALVLLWAQAGAAAGAGLWISLPRLVEYLAVVPAGRALLVVVGAAAACGVAVVLGRRRESLRREALIVALLGTAALPLTGHASVTGLDTLAVTSAAVHAGAASIWVGGLGAVLLFVAPRRGLAARVLPGYSTVAGWCLAAVALSGLLGALIRIELEFSALYSTGYGSLILAKTIALLLLAVFGARLRFRIVPGVARHQGSGLAVWASVELGIMLAAYGLAAVLAIA